MDSLLAAIAWMVYLGICLRQRNIRKIDLTIPTLVLIIVQLLQAYHEFFPSN